MEEPEELNNGLQDTRGGSSLDPGRGLERLSGFSSGSGISET